MKALAGILAHEMLESAKKQYLESLKLQALKIEINKQRSKTLQEVTEKFSEEVKENISSYIQSIGEMEAEIEYEGKPGAAFVNRAQMALDGLRTFLETQNPDGPIIDFLKQRYHEEGIRIITGRLYAGHVVTSKNIDTVEVLNKMGYAAAVDSKKAWLTGEETKTGIEEMLIEVVTNLFDEAFKDVDLSDDLALLRVPLQPKITKKPTPPTSPSREGIGSAQRGTIYITNGKENRRILPTEKIPRGWKKGRVKNW